VNIDDDMTILMKDERWADALVLARQAMQQAPDVAEHPYFCGLCLSRLDRHAEAYSFFLKAHELDPEWSAYLQSAFYCLYDMQDATAYLALALRERSAHESLSSLLREDCEEFYKRPEFAELTGRADEHP
jgi:tetratricopeptide (TPR) repeat protein